jgi:hypothetical protein
MRFTKRINCLLTGDVNISNRSNSDSVFGLIKPLLTKSDILYGNLEGCLYKSGENDIPEKKNGNIRTLK